MEMAKAIGGYIVQMSNTNWVQELAQLLKGSFPSYKNIFHGISDLKFQEIVTEKMKHIDLRKFISTLEVDQELEEAE